ncbi:MAG: phosphoribosyltransferase [Pseudoclavibacter sp.]
MTADIDPTHEHLTWETFGSATRELARHIYGSGYRPDVVVAIARGGLLPAGAIAYALGVKTCGSLNVVFYADIEHATPEQLPEPEVLPPLLDTDSLQGKKVLLVDDVVDSGRTMQLAVDLLRGRGAEVRSVTIYTKPTTIIRPDFAWRDTGKWIDFPWSSHGPVSESEAETETADDDRSQPEGTPIPA